MTIASRRAALFESWDGSASCNASDGELAAVGYSGSVEVCLDLLGCTNTSSGLGLRMVKDSDLQLVLGMNERRKTVSACA